MKLVYPISLGLKSVSVFADYYNNLVGFYVSHASEDETSIFRYTFDHLNLSKDMMEVVINNSVYDLAARYSKCLEAMPDRYRVTLIPVSDTIDIPVHRKDAEYFVNGSVDTPISEYEITKIILDHIVTHYNFGDDPISSRAIINGRYSTGWVTFDETEDQWIGVVSDKMRDMSYYIKGESSLEWGGKVNYQVPTATKLKFYVMEAMSMVDSLIASYYSNNDFSSSVLSVECRNRSAHTTVIGGTNSIILTNCVTNKTHRFPIADGTYIKGAAWLSGKFLSAMPVDDLDFIIDGDKI